MAEDNWKTLRVPPEAYEQAKAQKEKHGRTWGEQLVCDSPTTIEVVDPEEFIKELEGRIDDLESQLPKKVTEELQR